VFYALKTVEKKKNRRRSGKFELFYDLDYERQTDTIWALA
jgi:hypothetical protein